MKKLFNVERKSIKELFNVEHESVLAREEKLKKRLKNEYDCDDLSLLGLTCTVGSHVYCGP